MTLLETDSLSNQNISAAAAIGAYTVATGVNFVICDASLDQVAGNGDYVMYVTRQINGAGSAYVVLPKTTMTAASGETAIAGQSGIISCVAGDVLTCYVDGLAGDTTTPDTTVRWYNAGVAALLTTTMTEAYAADGAAATLAQALYEIMQFHNERTVAATTVTVKKRDGSTTAYTLDYDADSISRAT